jgi:hypothetical protein
VVLVLNDASDGIALIPAALAGRALKSRDKVGESQILTASCGANPAGRQVRGGNLLGLATEGLIASQTSPCRAVLGDSLHHCAPLSASQDSSPALLRLGLRPAEDGLLVDIVKRRGPARVDPLSITLQPTPVLLSTRRRAARTPVTEVEWRLRTVEAAGA